MARFNIDRKNSVFIGDSQRDVDAASKVGVEGFLINSNQGFLKIMEELQ